MHANVKSRACPLIARESALVFSASAFQPRFIDHVPWAMNAMAVSLSRFCELGVSHKVPPHLVTGRRIYRGKPGPGCYRSLQPMGCQGAGFTARFKA